jgi:hypothetical protein
MRTRRSLDQARRWLTLVIAEFDGCNPPYVWRLPMLSVCRLAHLVADLQYGSLATVRPFYVVPINGSFHQNPTSSLDCVHSRLSTDDAVGPRGGCWQFVRNALEKWRMRGLN